MYSRIVFEINIFEYNFPVGWTSMPETVYAS